METCRPSLYKVDDLDQVVDRLTDFSYAQGQLQLYLKYFILFF